MDLADGDTMRIGASSRIYELHWIPLRTAFEMDNHLVALPEARSLNHQAGSSVVTKFLMFFYMHLDLISILASL